MPDENDESLRILKRIDERLRRIERDLKASSEDQLFFAVAISLAVFLVTIPLGDLKLFFKGLAQLTEENAATAAYSVKNAGVLSLLISSAVRYYGAVVGQVRHSKTARVASLEFLIMAWNAFLFILVTEITFSLSDFLGNMTILVAALASMVIFICMAWVEKRVLKFYAARFLIFKKDVTPIVSNTFILIAVSMYFVFLAIAILVAFGVIPSAALSTYFIVGWILVFIGFLLFQRSRRPKRK